MLQEVTFLSDQFKVNQYTKLEIHAQSVIQQCNVLKKLYAPIYKKVVFDQTPNPETTNPEFISKIRRLF